MHPVLADTQSSSDDCGLLGFTHGLSISGNGHVSSGDLTVTVTGYNAPIGFADWSATLPILAVYVKGGPSGGNLFNYPAGDTGDQDLHTPRKATGGFYSVSHLAFCWNDEPLEPDVTIAKANDPGGVGPERRLDHVHADGDERGDATATGVARHRPTPGRCHVRRCEPPGATRPGAS